MCRDRHTLYMVVGKRDRMALYNMYMYMYIPF